MNNNLRQTCDKATTATIFFMPKSIKKRLFFRFQRLPLLIIETLSSMFFGSSVLMGPFQNYSKMYRFFNMSSHLQIDIDKSIIWGGIGNVISPPPSVCNFKKFDILEIFLVILNQINLIFFFSRFLQKLKKCQI